MGELLAGSVRHSKTGVITHANEQNAARVLYCVAQAITDCEIKVPNITAPGQLPVVTKACQVLRINELSQHVSQVFLQLPAGKAVTWHPGQYLALLINGEEFPFSIANAPTGRHIELHIRHAGSGTNAELIMAYLRENPTVRVTLPMGQRHVGTLDSARPLWLICGSTGFAQAKAIIEAAIAAGHPAIHLFWGARNLEELYLHALPEQWAADGLIDYTAVLSEEPAPGLAEGLVHEAVLAVQPPQVQPQCLIAGSPAMGWAVFDALTEAGFPPQDLHADAFDYAPRP